MCNEIIRNTFTEEQFVKKEEIFPKDQYCIIQEEVEGVSGLKAGNYPIWILFDEHNTLTLSWNLGRNEIMFVLPLLQKFTRK